jgi:hypothetical protein
MAYVVPNTFSANTTIVGSEVNANNTKLQEWINGGVVTGDISTASEWVEPKHIMKGYYNPIQNRYDLQSGQISGHPIFPIFHPGVTGSTFHKKGGSGRGPVPNMGIDFYLEAEADVLFYFTCSVRPYPTVDTSSPTTTIIGIRFDGSPINAMQQNLTEQVEVGADEGLVGPYRRRTWSGQFVQRGVSAGEHTIQFVSQSGSPTVALH